MSIENPRRRISCYEAVSGVDAAMRDVLKPDQRYYMLGGVCAGAIAHDDTAYDHESRIVLPTNDSAEPNIRDNNTLRDIDVLVLDMLTDEEKEKVKKTLEEAVSGKLEVSAFGVDSHEAITPEATKWTSRRTLDADGVHRVVMHPLVQVLPAVSYNQWQLELPRGGSVQTLNPAGLRLAYGFRSISGVRPKDKDKVREMDRRLREIPEFLGEMEEGDFRAWAELAEAVRLMRWPLPFRGKKYEHLLAPGTGLKDRASFRARAIPLRQAERNKWIVKRFGQSEDMQERLKKQVGHI